MKNSQPITKLKTIYEVPTIDIIKNSYVDVITTSGNRDENQGEWDPQTIDANLTW